MISSSSPLNLRGGDCEIAPKFKKSMSRKTLGEDISKLINYGDELDYKILSNNTFSDKVEINLNVFGSSMEYWVQGLGRGISVEIGSITGVAAVLKRGTVVEDAGIVVVGIDISDEDVGIAVVGEGRSISPVSKGIEVKVEVCVSVDLICGEESEPSFSILSVMQVRSTSHCSQLCGRVFALVNKIYPVVVVNSIMPHLLADLACRPFILVLKASEPNSSCINSCGSLNIPYLFRTSEGCYLDESFLITCNNTFETPIPFLRRGTITVLNISLDGELRVSTFVAHDCYNESGLLFSDRLSKLTLSKFPISYTKNKFTAVGCDTYVIIKGSRGQNHTTGCLSLCDSVNSVVNGSCSGIGCCQTSIPEGVIDFTVGLGSFSNHSAVLNFNPCGFGFVVEEKAYNFSFLDLTNLLNIETVPVVLDWAVGNETCPDAQTN
uniref:Wall-associated receptor kinase galacturonan-binding domain-containing protein n=1 Tax=Fagus sylvatica TaxID=28930 RepID=A0A2N9HLF3_FAGSY